MTKKIFQHSILLAFALLFSLTSCISEKCILPDPAPVDGAERTVSLRLASPTATTRGVSRPICDGELVQFNQGKLYLVSEAGFIVRYFIITRRGTGNPTVLDIVNGMTMGGTINIACLEDVNGVDIGSVPGNVRRVVLVGNSQVLLPTSGSISSVISGTSGLVRDDLDDTIASQYDAFTGVGVNMFANAELVFANGVWGAEMMLHPTVARFEIAQMTGMGNIESFRVAGIFIDRYYRQATRNGNFYPNNNVAYISHGDVAVNFLTDVHDYITKITVPATVTEGTRRSGALFTSYDLPLGLPSLPRSNDGVVARPIETHTWPTGETCLVGCCAAGSTVSQVWSFQLFAQDFVRPITSSTPAPSTTPPIIVVRLDDVVIRTGMGTETRNIGMQYLTIASFYRRNTGSTDALTRLPGIRASNVYHIANLTFDERDLYIRPNVRPRSATVEVELAEWNPGVLRPGVFRQPNPVSPPPQCMFTFALGAAVCGCATGTISYFWQQRTIGGEWEPAQAGAGTHEMATLITPVLRQSMEFRRRAHCDCTVGRYIYTSAVRTSLPRTYDPAWLPNSDPGVLIGGAIWATRNVGAPGTFVAHPADPGMFFQWGRNTGWSTFDIDGERRHWIGGLDGHWATTQAAWPAAYSGATWNSPTGTPNQGPCPDGWRLPTNDEFLALLRATPLGNMAGGTGNPNFGTWVNRGYWMNATPIGDFACQIGAIYGNPAGAHIFLPAAGWRYCTDGTLNSPGTWGGVFWGGMAAGAAHAGPLWFDPGVGSNVWSHANRTYGLNVRCVRIISQPYLAGRGVCPGTEINLGVATGAAATQITYRWEATPAPLTGSSVWTEVGTGQNFVAPAWSVNMYLRRVAIWNNEEFPGNAALMMVPTRADASDFPLTATVIHGGRTTVWATRNVDLSQPDGFAYHPGDPGMFFQWGRNYGWEWGPNGHVPTRRWNPSYGTPGNRWQNATGAAAWVSSVTGTATDTWNSPDGRVNAGPCPPDFRLPRTQELQDLAAVINATGGSWRAVNNPDFGCTAGHLVGTGTNRLFLPASGARSGHDSAVNWCDNGYFWGAVPFAGTIAWHLQFHSGAASTGDDGLRVFGFSVRCVKNLAQSVTITGATMLLRPNTTTLTATIYPIDAVNNTIVWSSSNPAVATINAQGVVTPVGSSTAAVNVVFTATVQGTSISATHTITIHSCDGVMIGTPGTPGHACWARFNLGNHRVFRGNHAMVYTGFWQWGTATTGVNAWTVNQPANNLPVNNWNINNTRTPWTAANNPCPVGWTLPTRAQAQQLIASGSVVVTAAQANALGIVNRPGAILGPDASTTSFDPTRQLFFSGDGLRVGSDQPEFRGALSTAYRVTLGWGRYWLGAAGSAGHAWSLCFDAVVGTRAHECQRTISTGHRIRCVRTP